MPAYIVFIREKTLDRSELEAYWSRASATMEGRPIKVLAAYGRHVTVEGAEVPVSRSVARRSHARIAKKGQVPPRNERVSPLTIPHELPVRFDS
jgi:hypothetical protein